jgi:hypothetical protein
MHQLNLEMLEQLHVTLSWIIERNIETPNTEKLIALISKSQSLLNEMNSSSPAILQYRKLDRRIFTGKNNRRRLHRTLISKPFIGEPYLKSYDALWKAEVEGQSSISVGWFSPFSKPSPFSSMTEMLIGSPTNDEALLCYVQMRMCGLNGEKPVADKLREEFAVFESTMGELYLLRLVAEDLKSFRRMIRLKRYD